MYHEDRWKKQNDTSESDVISESLEIWVSELLYKVKSESPGEVTVSVQGTRVEHPKVSGNRHQQQKAKSVENKKGRGIAQIRFGKICAPESSRGSTDSERRCYVGGGGRGKESKRLREGVKGN